MGEREGGRGIGRRFALTVAVRLSLRAMPLHKRKRVNRAAFAVAGYGSDAGGAARLNGGFVMQLCAKRAYIIRRNSRKET